MKRETAERRPRLGPPTARPSWGGGPRRRRRGWVALGGVIVVGAAIAAVLYLSAGRVGGQGEIAVLATADFHAVAFSPVDSNVVLFGHHNGVMRSDDGGRTWRALVDRRGFDAMGLAVSHAEPRRVYLAGHSIFQVSDDGGISWRPVPHNLPYDDIHGFAMSPEDPDRLYAFVVGHGLFRSDDGGRSWERLGAGLPQDVVALAAAGGTPETLYAGSMGAGVLKSTDAGRTWYAADRGLDGAIMSLVVHPVIRQTVYAGTDTGLYRSTDGGSSWSRLPFPGKNVVALAASPARPEVLLAIAVRDRKGLVYRSEDGGQTWLAGR